MGCYSDRCIARSKTVVIVLSIAFGIIAIVCAIFVSSQDGFVMDNVKIGGWSPPQINSAPLKNAGLALAAISILLACLGLASAKYQSKMVILPYMICTAFIGLVCVIVGVLLSGVGSVFENQGIKSICILAN